MRQKVKCDIILLRTQMDNEVSLLIINTNTLINI